MSSNTTLARYTAFYLHLHRRSKKSNVKIPKCNKKKKVNDSGLKLVDNKDVTGEIIEAKTDVKHRKSNRGTIEEQPEQPK